MEPTPRGGAPRGMKREPTPRGGAPSTNELRFPRRHCAIGAFLLGMTGNNHGDSEV